MIKRTIFKVLLFFEYEYRRSGDTDRQKFFADLLQRLKEVGKEYNVSNGQMKETFKSLPGGVRLGNPEPVKIMSTFYVKLIDSLNKTPEDIDLNDDIVQQNPHGKEWMMSLEEGDNTVTKDLGGEDDFGFETDVNDLDTLVLNTGEINFERVVGGRRTRKHFRRGTSSKCHKISVEFYGVEFYDVEFYDAVSLYVCLRYFSPKMISFLYSTRS